MRIFEKWPPASEEPASLAAALIVGSRTRLCLPIANAGTARLTRFSSRVTHISEGRTFVHLKRRRLLKI